MSKVINLRLARKRKARAEATQQAAENRAKFGRTREQRELDELEQQEAQRKLDALRREPGNETG